MGANEELIHWRECPTCQGNKTVPIQVKVSDGVTEVKDEVCPECIGKGEVIVNTEWR